MNATTKLTNGELMALLVADRDDHGRVYSYGNSRIQIKQKTIENLVARGLLIDYDSVVQQGRGGRCETGKYYYQFICWATISDTGRAALEGKKLGWDGEIRIAK